MSQDFPSVPVEDQDQPASIELSAKSDTILYQMRGLFVGYAGLEYLNRVIQQSKLFDRSKAADLNREAEILYSRLGRYNTVIELINKNNIERLGKLSHGKAFDWLEEITITGLYTSLINDTVQESKALSPEEAAKIYLSGNIFSNAADKKALKLSGQFYKQTLAMFAKKFRLEPDSLMVAGWFGFNLSLSQGYKSAYEALRMIIQDVNAVYGWDFFRISRTDYARHLEDLKYENIRGDQTTSIDAKAMLQLIVYGAWNNLGLHDALPIAVKGARALTIEDLFDLAGMVDCLGWLKEFHKIAFEQHWERVHKIFHTLLSEVRDPLMQRFQAQIDAAMTQVDEKFKPQLKHLESESKENPTGEHSFKYVFQINDDYSWLGGALPLNLGFSPYEHFEITPARDSSNISFLGGNPGSGKTTLLSSLACASIQKERQVVFIPLSDNFNWPTLAFMPQMEIEGHKRDNGTYYFNRDIGIKPEGVPTLILNVVKDLDELLGIPLTKYDRIVKVDAYSSFKLDMNLVLHELKDIASEFGYSQPVGIVAARYLYRKGQTGNEQTYNDELLVANTLLANFLKWRVNNVSQAMRVQLDEAAEGAAAATPSKAQYLLKGTLEETIRTARRANLSVEIATQLASEISTTVRNETVNNFFKNLKETHDQRKSPIDIMLNQLGLDEDAKNSVKLLQRDPHFVNSRAIFWHSSKLQKLNMIYTMPASFMPQVHGVDSIEIYRYYMRRNTNVSEDQFLMKEPELWVDLSEKRASKDEDKSDESNDKKW